ncbi:MAG: hypothetical protein E5299_01395 [Burkholderia gladioli]|nr:MAG: hypothetical protein E5299_01395 [Burkholderia gladioli]
MHLTRIRVEREMDFTPRAPLLVAVLEHLPFTFSIDLQTGAVDNQIDLFVVAKDRQFDIKRFCPATECGALLHKSSVRTQGHRRGRSLHKSSQIR